uniref:Uncharacterized protein n=1 Tax=Solanum tuberosum TaxID=4113 RepID=M1DDQ6_SOLTU
MDGPTVSPGQAWFGFKDFLATYGFPSHGPWTHRQSVGPGLVTALGSFLGAHPRSHLQQVDPATSRDTLSMAEGNGSNSVATSQEVERDFKLTSLLVKLSELKKQFGVSPTYSATSIQTIVLTPKKLMILSKIAGQVTTQRIAEWIGVCD